MGKKKVKEEKVKRNYKRPKFQYTAEESQRFDEIRKSRLFQRGQIKKEEKSVEIRRNAPK